MNTHSGNGNFSTSFGIQPFLSCDDFDFKAPEVQTDLSIYGSLPNIYIWNKPFYVGADPDPNWVKMFQGMYTCNTVIDGVMGSKGGTEDYKRAILSEALIHRAFAYFSLVNCYAKQYDEATSSTDPGVPLVLEAKLFVDLTRRPVSEVYAQIINDINTAIPGLPDKQAINFRPNKPSAYALLSKVYLNMRNFSEAERYADLTLAIANDIYDFNDAVAGTSFTFVSQFNDKQVLLRKTSDGQYAAPQLSDDLLGLLEPGDLRDVLFVRNGTNFSPAFTGKGYWSREKYTGADRPAVGLTTTDTWLIKAECAARLGRKDDAVTILNDLRKKRFRPANYVALNPTTANEALQLVVNERRREFFGTGMRWFDQKRFNKDPQLAKTVTRVFNNKTYTLEPNTDKYVFPLAQLLIDQNPEMVQNP